MIKNSLISLFPGEGQRKYLQVNAIATLKGLEKLQLMVEQGKLRVPIDSCWDLPDVIKVRSITVSSAVTDQLT